MNAHRDPDRLIDAFLREGAEQLHDQVYDAVRAEIERKRQRVVIGPWRMPVMNKFVQIGLGAAAVVVVLVVGAQVLIPRAPGGVGGAPSVTPSPTAKPTVAAPSDASALGQPVGSSWKLLDEEVQVIATIPAPGWFGDGNAGILAKENEGAGIISFAGELYVYGDPCKWSTTKPDRPAATVDEVIAALTSQVSRDATAPVDVSIGGYAGKSITLHVPANAVFSDCDEGTFGSWTEPSEGGGTRPARYSQGPGQIDELWVMDIDGIITVIDGAYFGTTPDEHVEELRAIVASATFKAT